MTTNADNLSPDQIAGMSIEELSALAGEIPSDDDESVNGDSQTPATDEMDSDKTEEGEIDQQDADKDKPLGVATKAGDKIIPYTVLEQTRQKAKEAEERAARLEQEKAEAIAKSQELAEKMKGMTVDDAANIELMTEEEIEAIEEELPELAESIRKMQSTVRTLSAQVAQQQQQETLKQENTAKTAAQEAIDNVPKLAFIQTKSPKLFSLAIEIDKELREDPAFNGKSLEERFEEVIERLEADIGFEIKLEGNGKALSPKKQQITSIDDIPGGAPPAVNEAQALLDRPPSEIAARMENMSLDQIHNLLDRIEIN